MEQSSPEFLVKDLYDMLLEECEQYKQGLLFDPWDPWSQSQTPEQYRRERLKGHKRGETIYLIKYNGNDAFVRVPEGVTCIGESAFADNRTLHSVSFPDTVQRIETAAFRNCCNLQLIRFGNSLSVIGMRAFENCFSLRKISLPDSVNCIAPSAFENCPLLEEVDLGNGLEEIAEDAFKKCKSLEKIVLPESLQMMDLRAFEGSSVRALYVPKNVNYITCMGYSKRSPIKKIEVDPENPHLYSKDNCVFMRDTNSLIGVVGKFILPQDGSLQDIGENMFAGDMSLTEYCVPEGVTTIWYGAFKKCKNLRRVSLPHTLNCILPLAFEECTALEEIVVPGSVKTVSNNTFEGAGIKRAVLKRGVQKIERAAFFNCKSLEEVYLPCTLDELENYPGIFNGCSEKLCIYIEQSSEKNYEKIMKDLEGIHVELIEKSEIFD